MRVCERHGLKLLSPALVTVMLLGSFGLLLAVLVPHIGVDVGGARRWIGAGPVQFQPSELVKLALVLFVARYLADNPSGCTAASGRRSRRSRSSPARPAADLRRARPRHALVVCATVAALLVAGGMPRYRNLLILVAIAGGLVAMLTLGSPYQRARLLSFLHPAGCARSTGFQASQGQIALGSGGLFGVGLGQSVSKIFYLPEAQTDFILAVIGEELGVLGVFGVMCLYGMIAYAGLRTARRKADPYAKLLATGLTSLILCQGILNIFVVLGHRAADRGAAAVHLLRADESVRDAGVGRAAAEHRQTERQPLRAVDDRRRSRAAVGGDAAADRDRGRRDRGTRGAGTGGRRRAAG
jgi:cell division protein FtsW